MKVKDLKSAKYNPRKISDKRLFMLKKSMQEFGDLSGIIYNIKTQRLIGGHQRIKHLDPLWNITKKAYKDNIGTIAIGYIETPFGQWQYREVEWDEKKEIAANIAANKHGGEFDIPTLKDLIIELDDGNFDIEKSGFEEDELKKIFQYDTDPAQFIEETLRPYKRTHILLSFSPELFEQIKEHIEKITSIEGIEYEQSSN